MKIAFGSDFHFEFMKHNDGALKEIQEWKFEEGTDIIIIAGDLTVGVENILETLMTIYDIHRIQIVYVPGNHEYYGSSFRTLNEQLAISKHPYIHILNPGIVEYSDLMICGGMGNIDGSFEEINQWKHGVLNDFHQIRDFEAKHVELGLQEHDYIKATLSKRIGGTKIVVTHTMPSPGCIHGKYKGQFLNPCFANDWSDILFEEQPNYWVCGHTHDDFDMVIDKTRIVCNPHGYPSESRKWNWRYLWIG